MSDADARHNELDALTRRAEVAEGELVRLHAFLAWLTQPHLYGYDAHGHDIDPEGPLAYTAEGLIAKAKAVAIDIKAARTETTTPHAADLGAVVSAAYRWYAWVKLDSGRLREGAWSKPEDDLVRAIARATSDPRPSRPSNEETA